MKESDGQKLTSMINDTKLTRLQIAEYLGVSERTVYRWMLGKPRVPRMVFISLELLLKKEL